MLDSRFSGGADAGEKATFSLTYGEARREKWVYGHLRKVVSASLWEAILVCLPLCAGGAVVSASLREVILGFLPLCAGEVALHK